jgi:hypothetical protein
MSSFELAGQAMLQMHEGNRTFAAALARFFSSLVASSDKAASLSSPTFFQQEPDLAKETHLPGTYIGSF